MTEVEVTFLTSHVMSSTVTVVTLPSRLVPVIVRFWPPYAYPSLALMELTVGIT